MSEPTRENLLSVLESIDYPRLMTSPLDEYSVMIATEEGYYDDPSPVPLIEGPFKFSAQNLSLAKGVTENDDPPEELEEEEWLEVMRMAAADCEPEVEYYRCNLEEDWYCEGGHSYFPSLEEAEEDLVDRVIELSGNITTWNDLSDYDLLHWCGRLGIEC